MTGAVRACCYHRCYQGTDDPVKYSEHDRLIFADGGEVTVVASAVCRRCGDIRSKMAPTEQHGVRLDLTGECNTPEGNEPGGSFGAMA